MNVKQAACLNCRKSKIKCRREEGAPVCGRCASVGVECIIPEFHMYVPPRQPIVRDTLTLLLDVQWQAKGREKVSVACQPAL